LLLLSSPSLSRPSAILGTRQNVSTFLPKRKCIQLIQLYKTRAPGQSSQGQCLSLRPAPTWHGSPPATGANQAFSNVQIAGSTFNIVGRDIAHNHIHNVHSHSKFPSRDALWAVFQSRSRSNFRRICPRYVEQVHSWDCAVASQGR
jgi:hypothetical protein